MADEPVGTLVRLEDTNLTVADENDDLRGCQVVDSNGDEIGNVDGLMIDEGERRVRFLEVGSGGFLGLGEKRQLIPIDAITKIEDGTVHIGKERQHVVGAPVYDPSLTAERRYYEDVYDYWGYPPFWGPGYIYTPIPHRPPNHPREP